MNEFEGGNLTLKSGGIGPDDYLFRRLGSRKWVKVVIRHGPGMKAEYDADLLALGSIFRSCKRLCVPDMQRAAGRQARTLQTMSAEEFLNEGR